MMTSLGTSGAAASRPRKRVSRPAKTPVIVPKGIDKADALMATMVLDCPHCLSDKMTFDAVGWRRSEEMGSEGNRLISVAAYCRSCKRAAEAVLFAPMGFEQSLTHNGDLTRYFERAVIFPPRMNPEAPKYVSLEVERAFLQGERNRLRGDLDAAGAMYRKALDVATKQMAPTISGMLKQRLTEMSAAGMLTPDIADWANHIRLLGNDATHDPDEPTQSETDDLANLTRMTLTYLFEMPERVRLMRESPDATR